MSCLLANAAFAQRWSVDLSPTPVGKRTYYSVVFLDGGKRLAAAGLNYDKVINHSKSEIRCWNVATGELDQTDRKSVV